MTGFGPRYQPGDRVLVRGTFEGPRGELLPGTIKEAYTAFVPTGEKHRRRPVVTSEYRYVVHLDPHPQFRCEAFVRDGLHYRAIETQVTLIETDGPTFAVGDRVLAEWWSGRDCLWRYYPATVLDVCQIGRDTHCPGFLVRLDEEPGRKHLDGLGRPLEVVAFWTAGHWIKPVEEAACA